MKRSSYARHVGTVDTLRIFLIGFLAKMAHARMACALWRTVIAIVRMSSSNVALPLVGCVLTSTAVSVLACFD